MRGVNLSHMGNFENIQGKEISIKKLTVEKTKLDMRMTIAGTVENKELEISFDGVSMLQMNCLNYPMIIHGFEIIDNKDNQWEPNNRFLVHDFEDELLNFFCRDINIAEQNKL